MEIHGSIKKSGTGLDSFVGSALVDMYCKCEKGTDCIRRILKHFYSNLSSPEDYSLIFKVAELVENYLAEVASDVNLKKSTFMSLAEMAFAASVETERLWDGLYRAIDTPEKHLVKDVISSDDGLVKPREEEISKGVGGSSESRAMVQMKRMNCKVTVGERVFCNEERNMGYFW
ncbi:hypothetical protein POM88_000025 [Heracleum sosnowskyi]|uniref:NPH3 domain-containing protein n=1 Tax=Heracleum sosnowskyi TaxID=360622 RepID=A0AAD8JDE3_9APIA|nr:hypothetical protein POM88_000025 [Heracleum sosnowskyi]